MVKSNYYSSFDIKVGDKVIADDISLEGTAQSNNVTFEYNVSDLDGKVTIIANGSSTNHHIYVDNIKICTTSLPSCTTPVLEDLSAQTICPGEDVSWTANNTASLQDGETIAYQWTKKGNATILSPTATLTLNDVTEATGGTYVVTAIVSAEGKASKTATKEVTLTVRPATATPTTPWQAHYSRVQALKTSRYTAIRRRTRIIGISSRWTARGIISIPVRSLRDTDLRCSS